MTSSPNDKQNDFNIDSLSDESSSYQSINSESNSSSKQSDDGIVLDKPASEDAENTSENLSQEYQSDYVLPESKKRSQNNVRETTDADDYIFTKYHGKRNRNHYDSENFGSYSAENSKHHHHHKPRHKKKWKHRPIWQKILIILGWIFAAVLALILIASLVIFILVRIGSIQLTDYSDINITAPTVSNMDVSVNDSGRTVKYNGKEYVFNTNVTSILCMGVDKTEFGLENDKVGTAGQCDALYLVAIDTSTGRTKIIGISRDIVTDIGIYSEDGEYLHTEKMQLCLAYAYGNGTTTSCLNTVTAVSRLFYQLPINSYFAINMASINTLNDAIGGVTVTLKDDLYVDSYGVRHYKGETVTLYGSDAERYLRSRDLYELESSYNRMQHQMNYLESYSRDAIAMTKNDISTPLNLYGIIADNSVTNLNPSKITAFATCIVSHGISELEFAQVPGTVTSDGTYAQFVVDEKGLYEIILDTFYTEK